MHRSLGVAVLIALLSTAIAGGPGSAEALPGEVHPVNPLTGVALSPCVSDDNGPPAIGSIRLSAESVDVRRSAQTVDVVVDASDTGGPGVATGVVSVMLWAYESGDGQSMRHAADGTWRGRYTVPRGSRPGARWLWAQATDGAGHSSDGLGFKGSLPDSATSLQVTGTFDKNPPTLDRLRLAKRTVDVRRHHARIDISLQASDRGSGVNQVTAKLEERRGRQWTTDAALHRVSGDRHRGRWAGSVVVPRWVLRGGWRPFVFATDAFGNFTRLFGGDPGVILPVVRVRSRPDTDLPTAPTVTASAATVDVRSGPARVAIDVRARDATSGVAAVDVDVDGSGTLPARLVSGTRSSGIWRAIWRPGPCDVAGARTVQVATVKDRAGRYRLSTRGVTTVQVHNVDRAGPVVISHSWDTSSMLRITFDEDVVGIGPDGAVLMRREIQAPSLPVGPVVGSWTCVDGDGVGRSCATGPVRTAAFTSDQPFPSGFSYEVIVNPDHVLDVTDLSGNPYQFGSVYIGDLG